MSHGGFQVPWHETKPRADSRAGDEPMHLIIRAVPSVVPLYHIAVAYQELMVVGVVPIMTDGDTSLVVSLSN